jgi:hypothetical protein
MFEPSAWEATPDLEFRGDDLFQKWRRFVWAPDTADQDRPTGDWEYEWRKVKKEKLPDEETN